MGGWGRSFVLFRYVFGRMGLNVVTRRAWLVKFSLVVFSESQKSGTRGCGRHWAAGLTRCPSSRWWANQRQRISNFKHSALSHARGPKSRVSEPGLRLSESRTFFCRFVCKKNRRRHFKTIVKRLSGQKRHNYPLPMATTTSAGSCRHCCRWCRRSRCCGRSRCCRPRRWPGRRRTASWPRPVAPAGSCRCAAARGPSPRRP